MADRPDVDREIKVLEAELKRLEAEYNMFFAGRLPRPPWETRTRVDAMVKRLDRQHIANYGDRFRFTTLQTRYAQFSICGIAGCGRARRAGRARSRSAEDGREAASAVRGSRGPRRDVQRSARRRWKGARAVRQPGRGAARSGAGRDPFRSTSSPS